MYRIYMISVTVILFNHKEIVLCESIVIWFFLQRSCFEAINHNRFRRSPGNWDGRMGIDDSLFPHQFIVDCVRVYQKKD
jgi:hypothetical protein